MTSVERQIEHVVFDLPDLGNEVVSARNIPFYLYAIVESSNTASIPTLSADEKKAKKLHRNISRRVSNSIFISVITVE
jgi:hypothetical protein